MSFRRGFKVFQIMTEMMPGEVPQMMSLGIAATERGEYAAALQLLGAVYGRVKADKLPQGLSSYGLCLARVEGKRKMGAELCQQAIRLQGYEGTHWANLVRVYIVAKNRRKAVETLDDSLRRLRNDPALIRVRQEIGYRRSPSIRFLSRRNPINKLYGRVAVKLHGRGKVIAIVLASLLYASIIAGVCWLIINPG